MRVSMDARAEIFASWVTAPQMMCRSFGGIRARDGHGTNAQPTRRHGGVYAGALAPPRTARNIFDRIDSRAIAVQQLAQSAPDTRSTLPRAGVGYTPRSDAPSTQPKGIARRSLERFALIAFALYHLPLFLNNYPSLGGGGFNDTGLAPRWGHIFTPPGVWVARHVFHLAGPMPRAYQGDNGDVAEEFARLLLCVVIGLAGAAIWSAVDRRKPRAPWVPETLRVLLRYSIALGLASYGIAKLLPMQFPPLQPFVLGQRVGDLSPMALLWTFMEYSRPYAFFGGLMECLAVLLLCVRRTSTLGALVCLAVMTNVALLNYAYGVPVKLYATMIVLSAAVLVLYDGPRLISALVTRRAVPALEERSVFHDRIPTRLRWAIKLLLVGSVTVSSVSAMTSAMASMRARPGSPADSTYRLLRSRFHLITE